jgi:chlorite dismutase
MKFLSNLKNKAIGAVVRSKMKGLPKDQQDMMIALVSENPDFFKKIQETVEAKKKQGQNEQMAMMQVMRENQAEIQKLMLSWQSKQGK